MHNILTGILLPILCLTGYPATADNLDELPPNWRQQLQPVVLVDVTPLKPDEQKAIIQARNKLDSILGGGSTEPQELAAGFGRLGNLYLAHELFTSADACYHNAMLLQPDYFPWAYYSAYLAQELGKMHTAVPRYKKALQLDPEYLPVRYRLANVYLELNRLDEAATLFRSIIHDPELMAAAHYGLGQVYLTKREYDKAAEHFGRALELQPEATQTHYPLALSLRATGNTQLAKQHLEKSGRQNIVIKDRLVDALEALKDPARRYFVQAMIAVIDKEYQKAVNAFKSGLEYEPDNTAARTSFARALYLNGDKKQARIQLQQITDEDPDKALALFLFALLDDEENNKQSAIALYKRVLKIDPAHEGANFFLANYYLRNKDYLAAITHYKAALENNGKNLPARTYLLVAMMNSGTSDKEILSLATGISNEAPNLFAIKRIQILLLAFSKQDGVRNTDKAVRLANQFYKNRNYPANLELLALATAANGDFELGTRYMRNALDEEKKYNNSLNVKRMAHHLELLESKKLPELEWKGELDHMMPPRTRALPAFRDYPDANPI